MLHVSQTNKDIQRDKNRNDGQSPLRRHFGSSEEEEGNNGKEWQNKRQT